MKNIKSFKYVNTKQFNIFLKERRYSLNDVSGFKINMKFNRNGNILKIYSIYFKYNEVFSFWVINFKSFSEYQASFYKDNNMFEWNKYSNLRTYKVNKKMFIAAYC